MCKLDGTKFAAMIRGGAKFLEINKKTVNMLNVFPVPDGDTGTNMFYTVSTAVKETEQVTSGDISDLAAAYSKGTGSMSGVLFKMSSPAAITLVKKSSKVTSLRRLEVISNAFSVITRKTVRMVPSFGLVTAL